MKILNFGSLNIDYVYSVDHIVSPGETISSLSLNIFEGGKGLNQSIALARAGASVFHAGCVGEDGMRLLELCKREDIDVGHVTILPQNTGHAIIQVSSTGQNSIIVCGGTNKMITKDMVDTTLECFEQGDFLVLQNEINLLEYIIDEAYERGMRIALNPSPFNSNIAKCKLKKVSIFLLNEIEAQQITGTEELDSIIKTMRRLYPDAQTVITLGERGAVYLDSNDMYNIEAKRVDAVDTTAAGDTFTGYFLASIANGDKPEAALKQATIAAGISVTRMGAVPSIPYRTEINC